MKKTEIVNEKSNKFKQLIQNEEISGISTFRNSSVQQSTNRWTRKNKNTINKYFVEGEGRAIDSLTCQSKMKTRYREFNNTQVQPFISHVYQSQMSNNINKLNESARVNNEVFFRKSIEPKKKKDGLKDIENDLKGSTDMKRKMYAKTPLAKSTIHEVEFKRSSHRPPMQQIDARQKLNSLNHYGVFLKKDQSKLRLFNNYKSMSRELAKAYMRQRNVELLFGKGSAIPENRLKQSVQDDKIIEDTTILMQKVGRRNRYTRTSKQEKMTSDYICTSNQSNNLEEIGSINQTQSSNILI